MTPRRSRGAVILSALALMALVFEGGSLPHVHDEPGWYNQEHDLGYQLALAAAGVPATIAAAPVPLAGGRSVDPPATQRAPSAPWRYRAARAPPTP